MLTRACHKIPPFLSEALSCMRTRGRWGREGWVRHLRDTPG